jgi:hypothetical protein
MSAARGKVIGSTTRNIEETLLTVTGEQQTSLGQTIGSSQALVVQAEEPGRAIALVAVLVQAIVPVAELVQEIDRVVVLVQVIVQAALDLGHDPVAELELGIAPGGELERETDPVAEELVLAPAAELAIDQPHGHLAVLAETKLVTGPHHRGLAHLTVEDLAVAAAETSLELAAAEAVAAWAAAE